MWAGDPFIVPLGDKDIPLPGVSGEFEGGWGVEGGATPTICVRPLRGEDEVSGRPTEVGGGLSNCGDTLGRLEEAKEFGEELPVREFEGLRQRMLETGPPPAAWPP